MLGEIFSWILTSTRMLFCFEFFEGTVLIGGLGGSWDLDAATEQLDFSTSFGVGFLGSVGGICSISVLCKLLALEDRNL